MKNERIYESVKISKNIEGEGESYEMKAKCLYVKAWRK